MDKHIAREAVRKERAMTRQSVILKAIRGDIRWMHAADYEDGMVTQLPRWQGWARDVKAKLDDLLEEQGLAR